MTQTATIIRKHVRTDSTGRAVHVDSCTKGHGISFGVCRICCKASLLGRRIPAKHKRDDVYLEGFPRMGY